MDFSKFAYSEEDKGEGSLPIPTYTVPATTVAASSSSNSSSGGTSLPYSVPAPLEGLPERYKSPYQRYECRLRLLIVGHNPSFQSFTKGHYYANPANRMWQLLTQKAGILPLHYHAKHDVDCPFHHQIGFTDVCAGICETISGNITDEILRTRKSEFYERLINHCKRVQRDCQVPEIHDCAPQIIAFAGVRQFKALFPTGSTKKRKATVTSDPNYTSKAAKGFKQFFTNTANKTPAPSSSTTSDAVVDLCESSEDSRDQPPSSEETTITTTKSNSTIPYGIQRELPPDWPDELKSSIVFLLPSSSGAAAMTNEQREQPYIDLGALMKTLPPLVIKEEWRELIKEEDKALQEVLEISREEGMSDSRTHATEVVEVIDITSD